jgi:nucleotide-binding universal stress UspA family protein
MPRLGSNGVGPAAAAFAPCHPAGTGLEAEQVIRNILVALDGSQHAEGGLEYALWLASRLKAKLVGTHVIDIVSIEGSFLHDVSGSLGFEPYLDFSSKMREALQERGAALLDLFKARCGERGVACDTALPLGVVANEICDRARTADLVVLGHRGVNEQFSTGLLGGTTESVARKSPKPVLVCPATFREVTKPLLAYDGSQRASAAMHTAAEVTSALGLPLTVVHVARDGGDGAAVLDEARRYLAAYDVAVSYETLTGPPHQRIIDVLNGGAHDLLFIGAYGHSRIIEMVLGSTTEYVLRNSPAPVFLTR